MHTYMHEFSTSDQTTAYSEQEAQNINMLAHDK